MANKPPQPQGRNFPGPGAIMPQGPSTNPYQVFATEQQLQQLIAKLQLIINQANALIGFAMSSDSGGGDGDPGPPGQQGPQGPSGPQGPTGPIGFGIDGQDGEDGFPIPGQIGPPGPQGNAGSIGPTGPIGIPGQDGDPGDDGFHIPGQTGPAGPQGLTGPQGPIGFAIDGLDGEDTPWRMGPIGPAGPTGTTGPAGPIGFATDGIDGEDTPWRMGLTGPAGPTGAVGPAGPIAAFILTKDVPEDDVFFGTSPSAFLPIGGGIMQGPIVFGAAVGSISAPELVLGPPNDGLHGDGTNIYISLNGVQHYSFGVATFDMQRSTSTMIMTATRTDATLASAQNMLRFEGVAPNNAGTVFTWNSIRLSQSNVTPGSEQGELSLWTLHTGGSAVTQDFTITNGELHLGARTGPTIIDSSGNVGGQITGILASPVDLRQPAMGAALTLTIGNGTNFLIISPGGTGAMGALDVTFPAAPQDQQEVNIAINGTATGVTLHANAGQSLFNGLPLPSRHKYNAATTSWYRVN